MTLLRSKPTFKFQHHGNLQESLQNTSIQTHYRMLRSLNSSAFQMHMSIYYISCFSPLQITGEFRQLKPHFQEVIADITEKMGGGMTVFLERKVNTMTEWDEVSAERRNS